MHHPSLATIPRRHSAGAAAGKGWVALLVVSLGLVLTSCTGQPQLNSSPTPQLPQRQRVLRIWWEKGFNLEEDEAIQQVVNQWQQQSGQRTDLTFYTTDELPQKAERALASGNPPDIMMSHSAERTLNPRLAWEGKLVDVTAVIAPMQQQYTAVALDAVYFYNRQTRQRRYYAVPLYQATIHLFYWRDLLQRSGRSDREIPQDWQGFWSFWQQVQQDLKAQQQPIYALGFPLSTAASDTYYWFEQVLAAYDAQILDAKGQLLVDQPTTRQGIINALRWYTELYQQGFIPPDALKWLNPDNNRSLLNRHVLLTPNATLSIPATLRQDRDTYQNKLGILPLPRKPNGQPLPYLVTVKQAVIFTASPNPQQAQEFLSYLIQPQVIGTYLKTSGGRNLPVMHSVWQDPFWTDPTDPHIAAAAKVLTQGPTRPFYYVQNPAYSTVLEENVWGQALTRIVVDGLSPEQAADEAIARIKEIFAQWQ